MASVYQYVCSIDQAVAVLLIPLAFWLLISGIDDLVLNLAFLIQWLRERRFPTQAELESTPERAIAIFVPAWHEHRVIGKMLEHNTAAVQYRNYHFFVGVYPNDTATMEVALECEQKFGNVHLAINPHHGPTSKADCLNRVYERMLEYEARTGVRFDIIVTHDSEDLIHPNSLRWINCLSRQYDMVQVPVIPLPTPVFNLTHGIYCDEFTENHTRDMRARQLLGAFIPSCGVGTGFTRAILERLAAQTRNRIFEPVCLTEDYENGLRIHSLGAKQIFIPILKRNGSFMTTREYFPQTIRAAIKQRTRWVTGIALQTWERHGWKGDWVQKYWLWRDRKGLIGNLVGLCTSALTLYGAMSYGTSCLMHTPWTLAVETEALHVLFTVTLTLGLLQMIVRMLCVARCYGVVFALAVPLRIMLANVINSLATLGALKRYARAKFRNEPLVWLKTEHSYPNQGALGQALPKLGEVLQQNGYLTPEQWATAVATKPAHLRMERHLVRGGFLTEAEMYEALSLQGNVPHSDIEPSTVPRAIARSLPADFMRQRRVLPFKVQAGHLHVSAPELPTDELHQDIKQFTSLEVRFHLVTPANFAALATNLL